MKQYHLSTIAMALSFSNMASAQNEEFDPLSHAPKPKGAYSIDLENSEIVDEDGSKFPIHQPETTESLRETRAIKMDLSPLEQYVISFSLDGMPYREVSRFEGEDLTKIKKMLHDPQWSEHWERIARAIGMLGDKSDAKFLIDFIEKFGDNSERAELAKLSALESLGFIVARHQDQDSLAYLKKGASPQRWKSIASRYGSDGSLFELYALNGLSYSGQEEAIQFLESQRQVKLADTSSKKGTTSGAVGIATIDALLKHARSVQLNGQDFVHEEPRTSSEDEDGEIKVMH